MITVTLTQERDGSGYRVQQLVNSCKLSIGQIVSHADVQAYCACSGQITVRIIGLTPEDESASCALLADDKPASKRSRKLEQTTLSIAKV